MERSTVLLGIGGLVVVVGLGLGGAYAAGMFPTSGGGTPPPVNTSTNSSAPLAHTVVNITTCGQTCRLMNTTVTNEGNSTAEDTTVHYRIYSGDEQVWRGNRTIGTLAVNETAALETRIEVGMGQGMQIRSNDGDVLIRSNITSSLGTALNETEANVG